MPEPRVNVPDQVAKDEVFMVRALITHRMDTGLLRDGDGNVIPRFIINRFVCRYNGETVFAVDLHEAVSANPYLEFYVRARDSGTLDFVWDEDGGATYTTQRGLTVV